MQVCLRRYAEYHIRISLLYRRVYLADQQVDIFPPPVGKRHGIVPLFRLVGVVGGLVEIFLFSGIEVIVEVEPVDVVFFHDFTRAVGNQPAHLRVGGIVVFPISIIDGPAGFCGIALPFLIGIALGKLGRVCFQLDSQRIEPRMDFQPLAVGGLHHVCERIVPGMDPLPPCQQMRPREVIRFIQSIPKRAHLDNQRIHAAFLGGADYFIEFFLKRHGAAVPAAHIQTQVRNPYGAHLVHIFREGNCQRSKGLLRRPGSFLSRSAGDGRGFLGLPAGKGGAFPLERHGEKYGGSKHHDGKYGRVPAPESLHVFHPSFPVSKMGS